MQTQILTVQDDLTPAFETLQDGGLVAFPTETVYGLGAHGLNSAAVEKIYVATGRPSDNPLIVHIGERSQLSDLVTEISEKAHKLMDAFWPGALTLIFYKKPHIPDITTGGLQTVAVRMPNHPLALEILQKTKLPLAAPSANLSGRPSPTTAHHVKDDMDGRIPYIIDGGPTRQGLESTVVDMTGEVPSILRPGSVTREMIEEVLGLEVRLGGASSDTPMSPGMKYTHYAPKVPMILLEGGVNWIDNKIKNIVQKRKDEIITVFTPRKVYFPGVFRTFHMGSTPEKIAPMIFSLLREIGDTPTTLLIVEGVEEQGVGLALMNRLRKAATEVIKEDV